MAELVPACSDDKLRGDTALQQTASRYASALTILHNLCNLVAGRTSQQIATHVPKHRQQSYPEKHQRRLQPIPLHEPKHTLGLFEPMQSFIHPNPGAPACEKIQQNRIWMILDYFV